LKRNQKEREYDLIASAYRNPEKEDMRATIKLEKETAKLNKVKQLQANTFNIVSHQGPPRKVEALVEANKTKGVPPRKYNFVTNLSLEDHAMAPTLYDEAFTIARAGKPKEKRATTSSKDKEFSIINNKYYDNHELKKEKEYQDFKAHTLERYWATHDYDPIRGKFFDAEKEERYRQQRDILSQVHGSSQALRLAPGIQYSEGKCYDIVNHAVHDEGKISVTLGVADRSLHRIKRVGVESKIREEGQAKQEVDDERRMGRISYKRWEQGIDRGYDFLKNSVHSADMPQPLPSRPVTMWARLQTTGSLNGTLSGTSNGYGTLDGTERGPPSRGSFGGGGGGRGGEDTNRESFGRFSRGFAGGGNNASTSALDSPGGGGASGRDGGGEGEGVPPVRAGTAFAALGGNGAGGGASAGNTARIRNLSGAGPKFSNGVSAGAAAAAAVPQLADSRIVTENVVAKTNYNANAPPTGSRNNQSRGGYGNANNGSSSSSAVVASSSINNNNNNSNNNNSRASAGGGGGGGVGGGVRPVPSLDLSRAEAPEPVTYVEPTHGPMGLSVPMIPVRTGGGMSRK
jgi:hypothetical protein